MSGCSKCPRCGQWSVEHLKSYCHCWECNYFPEENASVQNWQNLEFRNSKIAEQRRIEERRLLGNYDDSPDHEVQDEAA